MGAVALRNAIRLYTLSELSNVIDNENAYTDGNPTLADKYI